MRKTRIGIEDIRFDETRQPNGDFHITASVLIQAHSSLGAKVERYDQARIHAKKYLIELILRAVYEDVWDIAAFAEILLSRAAPIRFQRYGMPGETHPVMQLLAILGQIGRVDDRVELDRILEPYRHPERKPKQ